MAARPETKVLAPAKRSASRDLAVYPLIRNEIVNLLQFARQTAARAVNAMMTATYWEIGRCIVEAEQKGKRKAGYGEQLIERLAEDLSARFGRGFSRQNLWQMHAFYQAWPLKPILQTASGEFPLVEFASKAQTPSVFFVDTPSLASIASRAATTALTLEEKLAGQKQIKSLEAQRNLKRRTLFDAQDQVDQQREELIAAIEGKMNQGTRSEQLFSIRWTIA